MITGGNVKLFVSDLDLAVAFYTETLGFPLKERYENQWAAVDAGNGLIIWLHPPASFAPRAGIRGSISIGLDVDAAFVWWASRSVGVTAGIRAGVGPAIDLRTLAVDGAAGWGWLEAGLAF